jgi:hypothetical protein
MPVQPPDQVHLSELLGAMSYALDLTEGQPAGHSVRATWIGLQLGRELKLSATELERALAKLGRARLRQIHSPLSIG